MSVVYCRTCAERPIVEGFPCCRVCGAMMFGAPPAPSITVETFAELLDAAKLRKVRTLKLDTTVNGAAVKLEATLDREERRE